MPGIVTPINDIMTKISTLSLANQDAQTVPVYVRIWNNQVRYEHDGQLYNFPKPAIFVEVVSPATYEILGQGLRSSDISFRLHLVHENLNNEGTFEQDLNIFEMRDKVIALLTGYQPTNCGPLNAMIEQQDFEHTNVYHYVIDMVANFTDTVGSKLDPNNPNKYVSSVPPLTLEIDETNDNSQVGQPYPGPQNYIIPTKQLR